MRWNRVLGVLFLMGVWCRVMGEEVQWTTLQQDVAPAVSYAITEKALGIRVENPFEKGRVVGRLAVGRSQMRVIELTRFPAVVRYDETNLGTGPLRLALEVTWYQGEGQVRDRRVYFSNPEKGRLPTGLERLAVFDVKAHLQRYADEKVGAFIPFEMKTKGYASVVIEDEYGHRVRNLVSTQPFRAGTHRVEWDGRNAWGQPVAPGKYRYRGITHPGIRYRYEMQLGNGDEEMIMPWGSNHGVMENFAVNSNYVFVGAHITEGGNMLVALTPDGKLAKAYPQAHNWGGTFIRLAADEQTLYLALQGNGFNQQPDSKHRIAIVAYQIENPQFVMINKQRSNFVYELDLPPDELWKLPKEKQQFLQAIEIYQGKLYLANSWEQNVMVFDAQTLELERTIPVEQPEDLALGGDGKLYVASGQTIGVLDADGTHFRPVCTLPVAIRTFSMRGHEIAVLGASESIVRFFDLKGREVGHLGEPGGRYAGPWRERRLIEPVDVQYDCEGLIWTAEYRRNPKRIVRWNRQGDVVYTKYGCPSYGSPSCGFDPKDGSRFFAEGVEWKVDYDQKTAKPVSVLWGPGDFFFLNHHQPTQMQVTQYQGRTFVISNGRAINVIAERLSDGSLKPMAMLGAVHRLESLTEHPVYSEFVKRHVPEEHYKHAWAKWHNWSRGIFWLDKNGNASFDDDEFTLLPGDIFHSVWGMHVMNLTLNLSYWDKVEGDHFISIHPDGFLPNGVLHYDIERAIAQASRVDFDFPPGQRRVGPTTLLNDSQGNMIFNTEPWMMSITPSGQLKWYFENPYPDVHGSHKAPPPQRGIFQGGLFSLGVVPFDNQGDLFAFHSNSGQIYFFTTDGILVDQLFKDQRSYSVIDYNLLGEEAFGGSFQYIESENIYRLQAGGGGYRIYTLEGFDQMERFEGELDVTYAMLDAALRRNPDQADDGIKEPHAVIPRVDKVQLDRGFNLAKVAEWSYAENQNVCYAAYDQTHLALCWAIQDTSAWKNSGQDWTQLFKTGDSVDFQICFDPSVTNQKDRRETVPGDLRFLIAPFGGEDVAVLYRFRMSKPTGKENSVRFSSPWRTYTVADVQRPEGIQISRLGNFGSGYRIRALIPLSVLGVTAEGIAGKVFRGDFGVIYSDREGRVNLSRAYWANRETGLVSDVPGEIMPPVHNWGKIEFGK